MLLHHCCNSNAITLALCMLNVLCCCAPTIWAVSIWMLGSIPFESLQILNELASSYLCTGLCSYDTASSCYRDTMALGRYTKMLWLLFTITSKILKSPIELHSALGNTRNSLRAFPCISTVHSCNKPLVTTTWVIIHIIFSVASHEEWE